MLQTPVALLRVSDSEEAAVSSTSGCCTAPFCFLCLHFECCGILVALRAAAIHFRLHLEGY